MIHRARADGRKNRSRFAACAASIAACVGTAPAARAQPPTRSLSVDVGECVALESPEERFACYERRVAAERRGPTAAPEPNASPPPAAPAAVQQPGAASARRNSSASAPVAPSAVDRIEDSAPRREGTREDGVEYEGTITALRTIAPRAYEVTLDDGQVWRQVVGQPYLLEIGQRVRIYPTQWGSSYRLSAADRKGFVQVKRVE